MASILFSTRRPSGSRPRYRVRPCGYSRRAAAAWLNRHRHQRGPRAGCAGTWLTYEGYWKSCVPRYSREPTSPHMSAAQPSALYQRTGITDNSCRIHHLGFQPSPCANEMAMKGQGHTMAQPQYSPFQPQPEPEHPPINSQTQPSPYFSPQTQLAQQSVPQSAPQPLPPTAQGPFPQRPSQLNQPNQPKHSSIQN